MLETPSRELQGQRQKEEHGMSTAHKRLITLLDYIEQAEKINRKPAFRVPDEFYCAYEENLRGLPGIEFDLTSEDDEVWLRVPRLKEDDPPLPSDKLKPWIILSKNPNKGPTLRPEIAITTQNQKEAPQTIKLHEAPEIEQLFGAYIDKHWAPWAEYERPRRKTMAVYTHLFSINQTMETEGTDTPLELVWGVGIALWKHHGGQQIKYPILTQLVEITLETRTLALEVRPRKLISILEADLFAALNIPGVMQLESAWRSYLDKAEDTLSPFDPKSYESILKASVGFLDPTGRYWPEVRNDPDNRCLPGMMEYLTITDTWVLFARKRSPNFLIEDLLNLKKNLESVKILPGGPAAIVSEPSDEVKAPAQTFFRGLSFGGGKLPNGTEPKELYFPKPYNEEQVSIVRNLETANGVVVQGPPGTGKTHTIANVICHYLANGKRVLVTSKGETALAVLRNQIPESIRALTVALLTDEKDGMRQFEHAIKTIAAKISRINPSEIELEVRSLSSHIDELHARLSAIDREISKWASRHMRRVSFKGRDILPEELARYVLEKEKDYGWFPDKLDGQHVKSNFSTADIRSIRKARITIGEDIVYFGVDLPSADSFPDGNVILHLHEDLLRARQMATLIQEDGLPPLADARPETLERAQALFGLVQKALELFDRVYGSENDYTANIHQHYHSGNTQLLATLDELLKSVIELENERQLFIKHPVSVPVNVELDDEFVQAIERLLNGKRPLGVMSFGKGELKAKLNAVTVLSLKPQSQSDWTHVKNWLDFRKRCRTLISKWNSTASEFQIPKTEHSEPEALRLLVAYTEHITLVKRLSTECEPSARELIPQVFGENLPNNTVGFGRETFAFLNDILSRHLTQNRLAYASNSVSDLVSKLSGKSGCIVEAMREFLTKELGLNRVAAAEAGERWSGFLAELRRLAAIRGELFEVSRVSQLVESSAARKWAKFLRCEPAINGEDRWTPAEWHEAWNWRIAATFLDAIDGREALMRLQTVRHETENDLAHTYQRMIEQRTWIEVYKNSPDSVKAALQAYLNAVMHMGTGRGIRAIRYRKEARKAMLDAYRAVPCWVMPQWRVSETLPPEIGKFHLVIVDEASQSDLWALPCLLRGEKLLVVGDDKQVSPDGIGLAEEKIKDLKNRFLKEQVHGDQLTPEKSLYDLAKVIFAGNMVMLREHFRCVSPIIEFSKREFYQNEISPLRIPKPSERLDPPLVDVFVKGASRKGKVNEAEARAIVNEIKNILNDKRCSKHTIGAVSLLGIEQAHRIFELIREEIPAEDIVGRKLAVGDARTFQGNERDIMLLSMVATPDQKITATGSTYEQRFNVAASRARDRMYLFRSVELSHLNKADLKAKLIEHFAAPFRDDPVRVASLRELCQSSFEREMFDILVSKGYRVRPQVKVGGYSIDMIIEGAEDRRIAIECDGDQYHGPERWSADMARQRVLERAGWTFWRCFASSFNIKRKDVLNDLFVTLTNMGIEPIGSIDLDLSQYVEHRTADPFNVSETIQQVVDSPLQLKSQYPELEPSVAVTIISKAADPSQSKIDDNLGAETQIKEKVKESQKDAIESDQGKKQSISKSFSDDSFRVFLDTHGIQAKDNRGKNGALWVFLEQNNDALTKQLCSWGFQFKSGKGWWKA